MIKFRKEYKKVDTAGKKKYFSDEVRRLKRDGVPFKVTKLIKPVGKHKFGLFIRPIDLRTRKKR